MRPDGNKKGVGYLGVLKNSAGQDVTEFSIGVEIGGKEVDIPTVIPGLSEAELQVVLDATAGKGDLTPEIVRKAVEHAKKRIKEGKSPFADVADYTRQ